MKRGVIILVAVLVVIGVVFLILNLTKKSSTAKNTTLTVWIPFDEASTYTDISQNFLSANPTIKLDVKYIQAKDTASYEAQAVNAIANGNGPDIWMVRNDWIPKHIDKSTAAFTANGSDPIAIIKKSVIGNVVDANVFNGKLYGLPMSADSLAVIYNLDFYNTYENSATTDAQKTALKTVAVTWENLRQQVEGVSKVSGATVTRSGLALGNTANTFASADVLSAFLVQQGVSILSSDSKSIAFNLASVDVNGVATFPATSALGYYTGYANPASPSYSWNASQGDPITAFLNQKTGALIGYYSTLKQILAQNPKFNISIAPMVQVDSTVKNRVDYGNSWSLIVNKNSTSTDAAWSYLGYLAGGDVENSYAQATGKLSVASTTSHSILDTPALTNGAQSKPVFLAELYTMKSFYKPEWQQVDQILQDTINLVVNSNQAPQTSVDTAASRFKSLVGQ